MEFMTPEEYVQATRDRYSEAEFQRAFLALAKTFGWLTAHFRASKNAAGRWQTAVQGDGAGFPDTILVRGKRLIAAELKVGKNKTTPEQDEWLEAFKGTGAETFVWYPADWSTIEETLR